MNYSTLNVQLNCVDLLDGPVQLTFYCKIKGVTRVSKEHYAALSLVKPKRPVGLQPLLHYLLLGRQYNIITTTSPERRAA